MHKGRDWFIVVVQVGTVKIYVAPVGGHSGKRKDRMKLSLPPKLMVLLVLCLDNSIVGRVCIRVSIVMSSIPFIWWVPNLPPCSKLFSCNRSLTRLLLASSHPSSSYSQRGTFISILVSILGKRRKDPVFNCSRKASLTSHPEIDQRIV